VEWKRKVVKQSLKEFASTYNERFALLDLKNMLDEWNNINAKELYFSKIEKQAK